MNYNKLPKEYGKFVELKDTPNINTLDGWESPVKIVTENVMKLVESANSAIEGKTMEAIVNVGIDVDKDELIKAMQYDRDQYSRGYHNGYNAGYNADKWISVNDRLPERPSAYLVFTCDRRITMCHFIDHYCDGNMQFDDYRVTHWQPLPEPPEMEEE